MRATTFFEGVRQADIDVQGDIVKLPIFYYDGESMTGIFPAKLGALRKFLPDRRLSPARLAPGVGAISVTCFEYCDSDVGTYNELAIGIPLNFPAFRANLPGRAMLGGVLSGQLDAYVHHLPVTTELALKAGRELWNYPKFVASIDYTQDEHTRTCRLAEGAEHILTMRAPRIRSNRTEQQQLFTHVYQDGQPQRGEFKLLARNSGQTIKPGAAELEIGDRHPIAAELRGALLSNKSLAASYTPKIEGILFGPENVNSRMIQLAAHAPDEQLAAKNNSRGKAKSTSKTTV
ncbi:MAG: acetoacetate decarboxylase family protein [Thermoleophilia bacterium]|nr:acetoacetate decarboxylase family protein [Thermoleophilia bacterium]